MKIVKLKGGLGNQMFQNAFAKYVAKHTKDEVKLDFSSYAELVNDDIRKPRLLKFNISQGVASEKEIAQHTLLSHGGNSLSFSYKVKILFEAIFNKKYCFEWKRGDLLSGKQVKKYDYFDGYWQSIEYIEPLRNYLLEEFTPNYEISDSAKRQIEEMQVHDSVFVGVRKGDYTANAKARKHYGIITNEYYLKAMEYVTTKVENPVFHIFSNDIEWCKKNLDFKDYKVVFRGKEVQTDDFEELMIMKSCKHAIISNSTFNWWGAFLINNPARVIVCPLRWFNDDTPINIVPKEWHGIEAYR